MVINLEVLTARRKKLTDKVNFSVILWSGNSIARNFPANVFPFRCSSHFLYFAGMSLENAAIYLTEGKFILFMNDADPSSALWHGEVLSREQIAEMMGADHHFPLDKLTDFFEDCATIAVQDAITYQQQSDILKRPVLPIPKSAGIDVELARAIARIRLCHDQVAIAEIKKAAQVSMTAHKVGMSVVTGASTEAEVRASIESVIIAENMTCSYNSIVTVHGEVLHNNHYHHSFKTGDLLLADVGAETQLGYASDITRTYPVSGKFSPSQKDIYNLVLSAHDQCIDKIAPGVEYQDIHLLACEILAEGLVELGILKGQPQDLVEMDAHALFFPHGIGHLLGLDVHDMEDLGDIAGYEQGRKRSDRFGLGYLRLNRPLKTGMIVTIEPGFYQVPAILNDPKNREKYKNVVNWEKLESYSDVKGIRIEDDILVTETGAENLTKDLANTIEEVENLL
jgi:Xaa-Pro aminopeptidase